MRFEFMRTTAVVLCGDPLGKLVSLRSPRVMRNCGNRKCPSLLGCGVTMPYRTRLAHYTRYSELTAKFRI